MKPKAHSQKLPYLLSLVIIAIVAGLVIHSWTGISDWLKLLGYQPPVAVASLATQDTFTPYTRHLFYLNRPKLLSTVSSFRTDCPENPSTVVLGCYHPGQNGIYIYDVSGPSLAGVTEVTAAHEVLHAVYARLSSAERSQLDNQLQSYYMHSLSDQTVKAEVKIYQQTEPNSVYDEMSCTFGTEIANLPANLNAYYQKYFTNRQVIVNFENKYQGAFNGRQQTISADDAQLANIKNQIDANLSDLSERRGTLNSEQAQLNSESGTDQQAFSNQVTSFNAQVNSYNFEVSQTQSLINHYNQLVNSRNQIAGQLDTLVKALDTRLTPVTAD